MAYKHIMEWIFHGSHTYHEMDIPWYVHESWNTHFIVWKKLYLKLNSVNRNVQTRISYQDKRLS